ncbi:MAG TPA: serine hydrolase domain-containing protein, partial [Novosphingobium sp.]|nr:serine hydrolase domain-containing protein [Novosphingobium sp.]
RLLTHIRLGEADIDAHTLLPADAIFRFYSMSKPITSVAILMLAEEGRLRLDDPVARWLPAFGQMRVYAGGGADDMRTVPANRPITIEDLLLHRGGLTYPFMGAGPVQRYYRSHGVQRDTPVGRQPGDAPPAQDLAQLVERLGAAPLLHQPGEKWDYSYSTTVLGAVVEKASGQSLDAFLRQRIFAPLEMKDTGFVITPAQLPRFVALTTATAQGLATSETAAASEYRDPARLRDGGGALAGTTRDYLHFAEMLANGGSWHGRRLLNARSVAAMFTPRLPTGGSGLEDTRFGYGLAIGDAHTAAIGGLPVGAGSWSGSGNSYFFADRRRGLAVVFMTSELTPGPFAARETATRQLVDRGVESLLAP